MIPVGGWAPYLAEALDGVLGESPAEVVVVDDGSAYPIQLHPDHAARCRVVRREARGGPAAARNTGLAALGDAVDLVAFCDADDAWEPGSLAPRVAALKDWGATAAFGRARIVGPDGRETGELWELPPAGLVTDLGALYAHNPVLTSSVVIRREAARFDESYEQAEDWELWLRTLADGGSLACVPEAVVRYRRHPQGLTADVAALARAQERLHEHYASQVPAAVATDALRRDRRAARAARLRKLKRV